jgi:hypothetical protein
VGTHQPRLCRTVQRAPSALLGVVPAARARVFLQPQQQRLLRRKVQQLAGDAEEPGRGGGGVGRGVQVDGREE